jgi:hypothetical protein
MPSALRLVLGVEAKVHKSVVALARFHHDIATIAAIATGRPAARNVFLPTEGEAAVPTVPSLHPDCGFINEHQSTRFSFVNLRVLCG